MKRITILVVAFLLGVVCLMAQTRMERGQKAFNAAQYSEAITQWEAAAIVDESLTTVAEENISKAQKCIRLKESAQRYLNQNQFDNAESCYRQLGQLNPLDSDSKKGIERCKLARTAYAKEKDASNYWASIKNSQKKSDYETYLKRYPSNKNAKDARNMVLELEAWENAVAKNTQEGYSNYLEVTTLGLYKEEAEERLLDIQDEMAWQQAIEKNSYLAYQTYLQKYSKHRVEARTRSNTLYQEILLEQATDEYNALEYAGAQKTLDKMENIGISYIPTSLKADYNKLKENVLYQRCMNETDPAIGRELCASYAIDYANGAYAKQVNKRAKEYEKAIAKGESAAKRRARLGRYNADFNLGVSFINIGGAKSLFYIDWADVIFNWGTFDSPIGFSLQLGLNMMVPSNDDMMFFQTPLEASLRVNLFGNDDTKCFLAAGAGYNVNYFSYDVEREEPVADYLNAFTPYALGELGIRGESYKFSIYYTYDIAHSIKWPSSQYGRNHLGIRWAYYFDSY